MIYLLVRNWLNWLEAQDLGYLRVFTYVTFRSTVAVMLSFVICVVLGPSVIRWLRQQKIGDTGGFDATGQPQLASVKKDTPTMGGLLIVGAIAATTLLLGDLSNFYVSMALVCLLWLACVGAADDWLKLTVGRRAGSRQGLTTREKLIFQVGLGVVLSYFTFRYGRDVSETHTIYFPFLKNLQLDLTALDAWMPFGVPFQSVLISWGLIAFVLIGTVVLTGTSNAVNLTDGLDGLAAGCMAIVSFTFFVLALIVGHRPLAGYLNLTHILAAGEMAVLAGAIAGACLGFLWFNCNPAKVFMGDTGSLALGGLIGYIAMVIRQELLLFIVGGIFVIEAISVMLQVGYFKYTRRRYGEGRRIFLVAPLHHHFQKKGWTETQVVVRFWLIGAMLAAMALATVKLR